MIGDLDHILAWRTIKFNILSPAHRRHISEQLLQIVNFRKNLSFDNKYQTNFILAGGVSLILTICSTLTAAHRHEYHNAK